MALDLERGEIDLLVQLLQEARENPDHRKRRRTIDGLLLQLGQVEVPQTVLKTARKCKYCGASIAFAQFPSTRKWFPMDPVPLGPDELKTDRKKFKVHSQGGTNVIMTGSASAGGTDKYLQHYDVCGAGMRKPPKVKDPVRARYDKNKHLAEMMDDKLKERLTRLAGSDVSCDE